MIRLDITTDDRIEAGLPALYQDFTEADDIMGALKDLAQQAGSQVPYVLVANLQQVEVARADPGGEVEFTGVQVYVLSVYNEHNFPTSTRVFFDRTLAVAAADVLPAGTSYSFAVADLVLVQPPIPQQMVMVLFPDDAQ